MTPADARAFVWWYDWCQLWSLAFVRRVRRTLNHKEPNMQQIPRRP